jgi:hypothetical protein
MNDVTRLHPGLDVDVSSSGTVSGPLGQFEIYLQTSLHPSPWTLAVLGWYDHGRNVGPRRISVHSAFECLLGIAMVVVFGDIVRCPLRRLSIIGD